MGLGPVLRYELITTSRRGRYYIARLAYGLLLLYMLWSEFERFRRELLFQRGAPGFLNVEAIQESVKDMTLFAEAAFVSLAWSQWLAVLLLVPAMTAGVIADAHRRKTLRDLLSSGMSSSSIVLGKLGARLIHVGVFVAVGLPVVALIGLFGGLDPTTVFYVYLGTLSIAVAVGGVSILASTLARRPREAILSAYALELAWLIVPGVLAWLMPFMIWPLPYLAPAAQLLKDTHPFFVWGALSGNVQMKVWSRTNRWGATWLAGALQDIHTRFLIMAATQLILGLLCIGISVKVLRPLRAGDAEWVLSWSSLWNWLRRRRKPRERVIPARAGCGDDPMLWKEWHAIPRGGMAWLTSRPVVLFFGTLIGCILFDIAFPTWRAILTFDLAHLDDGPRRELNEATRAFTTWLFAAWWIAVASAGAVSLTSEREDDTWTSLTSTLLTGHEVIRAKILGAIWGTRHLIWAILTMIGVGVLGLGVHPLGAALAVVCMASFGMFAAALGVAISLRAQTSTRAMLGAVFLLAVIGLTPPYFGSMVSATGIRPDSFLWIASLAPLLQYGSLLSYQDVSALWKAGSFQVPGQMVPYDRSWLVAVAFGVVLHVAGAWLLYTWTARAYEVAAGRARRRGEAVHPASALRTAQG